MKNPAPKYPSILTVFFLCLFTQSVFTGETDKKEISITEEISAIVNLKRHSGLSWSDFTRDAETVAALYSGNGNNLLWFGGQQSGKNIEDALNLLAHADNNGLNPSHYDAELIQRIVVPLRLKTPQDATKEFASADVAITVSLLRLLHDIRHGRVAPEASNFPGKLGGKQPIDAASLLHDAILQQNVAELPSQVEPKIKQYQQLKQALANYRKLAVTNHAPIVIEGKLRPGEQHKHVSELRSLMASLAILHDDKSNAKSDIYDNHLADAVKKFQSQHGLQADGVIGKETLALLNQPLTEKVTQLELALEKLRWLPESTTGPLILVNIPSFQLWAFNSIEQEDFINMRVVVGKAVENQTPMLLEEMKYLEFMPYWNIPRSIMDKEIIPKLLSNNNYLANQDIELVKRSSSNDETEAATSIIDDLKQGRVRARQRPGKRNPLGRVKFIFPNKEDVYMHDTPSVALFNRTRRDFSHGCVRVEEPAKLAEFVLSNQDSSWSPEWIKQAMNGDKTQRVTLKKSIPVLFFYMTAFFDQNNQLKFYRDIYGHDQALQKAISKPSVTQPDDVLMLSNSSQTGS